MCALPNRLRGAGFAILAGASWCPSDCPRESLTRTRGLPERKASEGSASHNTVKRVQRKAELRVRTPRVRRSLWSPCRKIVMNLKDPLSAESDRFASVAGQTPPERPGVRIEVTRDHEAIRRWATEHRADPATGAATQSGPEKIVVNDGAVGMRFNFPGFAPFRPIGWDEWFDHFDQHQLLFVFEEQDTAQVATLAHEFSRSRGGAPGHD